MLNLCSRWHSDGPSLPVEFARISGGGRLTLVLFPSAEERATYWAVSNLSELVDARSNLAEREGSSIDAVDFYARAPSGREQRSGDHMVTETVCDWLEAHDDLDAAIWTGLASNWRSKRGSDFSVDDALSYVDELRGPELDGARDYITRAPRNIDTPVRRTMRARGWHDIALPAELFAASESNGD